MAPLTCVYVLTAFCIALSVQSTQFHKCDDGSPAPLDLRVAGCNSVPCRLVKGTDLKAEWDFEITADTESLKPRVRVTLWNSTADYPYPRTNACEDLTNGECPLEKGEEVTYSLTMQILKYYPSVDLTIEFALLDANNKVQVCFKFDGKVVNPSLRSILFP